MNKIVGIKFDTDSQIKYYFVNNLNIHQNQTIVAETEKGLEFGKVVTPIHPIDENKLKKKLTNIIRIASKNDYISYKENQKKANIALKKCKKLIKKLELNMNVIEAFYTLDQDHLIFNFYADNRVDFRDLARELAYIYKTRIELRQIGVRDKAKKVGGLGNCGHELCCARFLDNFDSVTISMAKNQNLSLNPNKINGVCGRLLCCLKYEDENYKECRKDLPKIGDKIETEKINGIVKSLDILNKKYKVELSNGNVVEDKIENGSNK